MDTAFINTHKYDGTFISLSGGEATGKSTMSLWLKEKLEQLGYEVVLCRDPGGVPSSEAIRNCIMDFPLDPRSELLLYLSARRELVTNKIIPALKEGKVVISDRFYLCSLAYQGYARGLGIENVLNLNHFICEDCYPNLNFIIDIPYEVSLYRKSKTSDINRLDLEGVEFHKKVEEGFKLISQSTIPNIKVIDGCNNIEDIQNTLLHEIIKTIKVSPNK